MNFGGTARALRTAAAVLLSVCCTGVRAATLPAHPRLLLDEKSFAALRERAQDDPLVALGAEKLRANADLILKEPPLRHELGGKRMLGVARRALMRLTHLALARRLFGEDRYRDAVAREMRNLAAFEDWNPGHFLDTAELALGYAIAYDWLHADLDDEIRERAEQNPRGVAAVTVLSEKPESSVCLDLTPCYAPDAKRVRRLSRFLADGRRWCLSDRLEGVRPGATVRWSMLIRAKVWIAGDGCAVLTQEGKRLVIEPRGAARGAAWSVVRNPRPNPDIDPPMKGMSQISLCLTMPDSGSLSYEMVFR